MAIKQSTITTIWGRSFDSCALCKTPLTDNKAGGTVFPVGEMAHIEGENLGSARYNKNSTDEYHNSFDNLLLLCPTCHTKVDKDTTTFTVAILQKLKHDHQEWGHYRLQTEMPKVSFAELEVITKYLINAPVESLTMTIDLLQLKDKLKKNNLSDSVDKLILTGMLQVNLVKSYLNKNVDILFAERLKQGFINKYVYFRDNGKLGDELFYLMLDFASGRSTDFIQKAAGLAVLTYFFELCEVFEK